MSLTVKTDDVTKGRKDVDPHGRLRAVSGGNGLIPKAHDFVTAKISGMHRQPNFITHGATNTRFNSRTGAPLSKELLYGSFIQ